MAVFTLSSRQAYLQDMVNLLDIGYQASVISERDGFTKVEFTSPDGFTFTNTLTPCEIREYIWNHPNYK